jgi:hypothetical protein
LLEYETQSLTPKPELALAVRCTDLMLAQRQWLLVLVPVLRAYLFILFIYMYHLAAGTRASAAGLFIYFIYLHVPSGCWYSCQCCGLMHAEC